MRFFLVFWVLGAGRIWGQSPFLQEVNTPRQVQMTSLSHLETDVRGFLGMAVEGRLLEFQNGHFFNQLPDSLAYRKIAALFKGDSSGFIVAYEDGLVVWKDAGELKWYQWKGPKPTAILRKGSAWMVLSQDSAGVYSSAGGLKLFSIQPLVFDALLKDDTVFLATDRGVWRFPWNNPSALRHDERFPMGLVKDISLSGDILAAAYYQDRLVVNGKTIELPPGETHKVCALGAGWAWLSEDGVVYSWRGSWEPIMMPTGQRVLAMEVDAEGALWLGTNHTMYRMPGYSRFLNLGQPITALTLFQGQIYLAKGSMVAQMNDQWVVRTLKQLDAPILALESFHGALYAGTLGEGLFKFDGGRWSQVPLGNSNVLSIKSFNDDLYVGTLGGIYCLHGTNARLIPPLNHRPQPYAYAMEAFGGKLFAATDGDGLLEVHAAGLRKGFSTPGDSVLVDLVSDSLGLYALSMSGYLHAFCLDTSYSVSAGWSEQFFSLMRCKPGLWMAAGNRGMHLFQEDLGTWSFLGQGRQQGGWVPELHARLRLPDGSWAIGTSEGVLVIHPDVIPQDLTPRVYLRNAMAGQQLFAGGVLPKNGLSLTLATQWNVDAQQVGYLVMLEGWDTQPYTTSESRFFYGSLPPGEYAFKAAPIMDGYSAQGLQTLLEFRVLPPVWQRWWFLVMASLILGLVVWMYFKWRESNLRRHQAMQQALADARYEALRSQVNPHFLFNSFNTLMALIETDTKRAGGYLNGLSRFFRSILQQREKSLERVGEELSLVFAYVELQKTRFEDALQLKMDVDDHWMNWGLPPLALQQLVENAIKHNFFSALQPLIIEVTVRESRLRVVNTYRPIPDSRHGGTSFGLQGLQRQLEALMKEPLVVGHNEVYFWVEIPLLPPTHAHFNH